MGVSCLTAPDMFCSRIAERREGRVLSASPANEISAIQPATTGLMVGAAPPAITTGPPGRRLALSGSIPRATNIRTMSPYNISYGILIPITPYDADFPAFSNTTLLRLPSYQHQSEPASSIAAHVLRTCLKPGDPKAAWRESGYAQRIAGLFTPFIPYQSACRRKNVGISRSHLASGIKPVGTRSVLCPPETSS